MKYVIFVAALASLIWCYPAAADLEDELENIFSPYTNVTSPSVGRVQGRGVLSGGSIYVRHRVENFTPVSFAPPAIKGAGCGGFDIYGGSLSFFNKDEMVAYLRSTMTNMAGYLFELGLRSVCESCASIMSKISDGVQKLNEQFSDSCQLAKTIVDKGLESDFTRSWQNNAFNQAVGSADQWLDGFIDQGVTGTSTTDDLAATDSTIAKDLFEFNVTWDALFSSALNNWISSSGSPDQFRTELMSMVGTVTGYYGSASSDFTTQIVPPSLTALQLILGNSTAASGEVSSAKYRPLTCTDSPAGTPAADCVLVVRANADSEIVTIQQRVQHLLFGGPARWGLPASPGLIRKMSASSGSADNVPLSTEELGLLNSIEQPVAAMASTLAGNTDAAAAIIAPLVEVISLSIGTRVLTDVLTEIDKTIATTRQIDNLPPNAKEHLEDLRASIYEQIAELSSEGTARAEKIHTLAAATSAYQAVYRSVVASSPPPEVSASSRLPPRS